MYPGCIGIFIHISHLKTVKYGVKDLSHKSAPLVKEIITYMKDKV